MKTEEIKAYNDVNWEKLIAEWGEETVSDMMCCAEISPTEESSFTQNYDIGIKVRPYTCTVFFYDTSMLTFDFANRNRLRNKIKSIQKDYDNIVGSIICLKRNGRKVNG